MQGVFQLVTIYKYVLFFQYIGLTVQITISYHEIKTHSFLLFLIKLYHSDLKAHIYRQENSAQQANTLK